MALQSVMGRNNTLEDVVRWARCLAEILKQAGQLCSETARAAYVEVSSRLQVSSLCCCLELHCGTKKIHLPGIDRTVAVHVLCYNMTCMYCVISHYTYFVIYLYHVVFIFCCIISCNYLHRTYMHIHLTQHCTAACLATQHCLVWAVDPRR